MLQIHYWAIQQGAAYLESQGRSLFFHYKEAMKLLWPEDDHHRWSDLALRRMLENEVEIFIGCGASNKSYSMARYVLTDWWAFPDKTLWLVSSTEYRGADLRIWGDIQLLFNRARKYHPWLPGHPLSSLHCITNQEMDDSDDYFKAARSLKRGLIVVPNKKGNTIVGLSAFVGVRVPRLRHAGDEVQAMTAGFSDAYSNWYGNSDFRGVMAGNPIDITDQLCTLAEPADGGWDAFVDTGKTQEWRAKFFNAHVIAFDGRDSPNLDYPNAETNPKFPYLVGPKKLKAVAETHGMDSWQWYSQCVGKPNKGMLIWRVITAQMCENNHAFDMAVWKGTPTTKIFALDPAYGGGDLCVSGILEFGEDLSGVTVIKIHPQEIVPINLRMKEEPEAQIAKFVKVRLEAAGIPPENAFYDSFGRGTLGYFFAAEFGASTPVPIDSGGQPSDRPVRFDEWIDEPGGGRRLKRCDEAYSKKITELWFSCAEAIQSGQVRELPKNVMREGCVRIYSVVKGNKLEVEPKEEMKERTGGKSSDRFDCFAIGVEGARQRGFKIKRIGEEKQAKKKKEPNWLDIMFEEHLQAVKSRQLQNA